MGLEIVELVMRIEEEFDTHIPDEDAEKFKTVGDIEDYVALRVQTPTSETAIFERLRSIVVDRLNVSENRVRRDARLVEDLGMD
jgi:acyl carrier protein